MAASESPPPATLNAGAAAIAAAMPSVPAANGASSNTPMGPFHRMVLASATIAENDATVRGPMSSPIRPAGIDRASTIWVSASAAISGAATTSTGSATVTPRSRARPQGATDLLDAVGLDPGRTHLAALRGEERERHGAPDEERVHPVDERVDHTQLVGDLGATEHGNVRPLRVLPEPAENADLPLQQAAGHRGAPARQHQLGEGGHARVGAVDGAEGVVHVGVGQTGQRPGERRVVGLLPRVEPEVLEQDDRVTGELGGRDLREGEHRFAEELGEPDRHRCQGQVLTDLTLRTPEVGRHDERGAPLPELTEGRQRRADPAVVGHPAVGERNVRVDPDEDTPITHLSQIIERRQRHPGQSEAATITTRSTSRLE